MKRYIKNIILIILILGISTGIYFTVDSAKDSLTTITSNTNFNMNNTNQMGEPKEKPSDDNTTTDTASDSKKPSDDSSSTNTPPEKPSNDSSNTNEPPEKPSGDNSSDSRPEMPSGDNSSNEKGTMPEMPTTTTSTSLDIKYYILFTVEGLVLSVLIMYMIMSNFNKKTIKETFTSSDKIIINILGTIVLTSLLVFTSYYISTNTEQSTNKTNNSTSANTSSKGVTTISTDKTLSTGEYTSSNSDENAILVDSSSTVTLENITVTKTGDSDGGDNTSFYGTNSAILAKDKATLTIKDSTIETNATGANGVFSYGGSATTNNTTSDGTTINISDSTITTSKDNSGGIMVTGGGVLNAANLTVTTSGTSSAAIRSDRGGGTLTVNKGTYTTNGKGSPSIYSTANITVKNATLVSNASEGVVIEGKNSVTLENVKLTDTNNVLNGQSTTYKNIFLYQSMSGDASVGTSSFTAKNSEIITNVGDAFYVTNTTAEINLTNNTITNNDSDGNFLRIQKDSWGSVGSNGADVTLNLTKQTATGSIVVDSLSTLTMNLTSSSSFTGAINTENEAKTITLTLDKTSKLKLTGDTYITSLENEDTTNSNIDFNGYKLYVNGTSIN